MWQAVLVFAGLSLDSFIVMMQKGAQIRNLTMKKLLLYTLVFAAVTVGMLMAGYGISLLLQNLILSREVEITIAALIIFFVGVFQITKSFMKKGFEEKLDDSFGYHELIRQALYTSIDVFFVGAAVSFGGYNPWWILLWGFVISFAAVFLALIIGYNLGAGFQRAVGIIGGVLMVFFSIYMLAVYVL